MFLRHEAGDWEEVVIREAGSLEEETVLDGRLIADK